MTLRRRATVIGHSHAYLCVALSLVFAIGCGGGAPDTPTSPPAATPVLTSITLTSSSATVAVGSTLQLTAAARDQQGRELFVTLAWSSSTAAIANVSASGLVTAVAPGTTTITVSSGSASASLAVTVTGTIAYVAGQAYFGRNSYIEYLAGNAPIILTAPHGGALAPTSIPDRIAAACGGSATTVTDANTSELVRVMQQRYFARHGAYPHVIISNLSRRKLDPNRVPPEAACGNADAAAALFEWHAFIDIAKRAVLASTGRGWYMDIHGHGHPIPRLELGYLLADADLNLPDVALDASLTYENTASIRTLSQFSPLSFATLLRGPHSLGTLYANNGFPSIPSATDPRPNGTDYFNGGDNTVRHSCGGSATSLGGATGGNICGVQIEANFTGVRNNAASRDRFGDATAVVLEEFLRVHWGIRLASP